MMDRLTGRAKGGGIDVTDLSAALERLAAYEDLGLDPAELRDLKDAWEMYGGEYGITEALKHTQRWISVEERLPEHPFNCVLICIRSRNGYGDEASLVTIGAYDIDTQTWQDLTARDGELCAGETVSHWMPLPEAADEP